MSLTTEVPMCIHCGAPPQIACSHNSTVTTRRIARLLLLAFFAFCIAAFWLDRADAPMPLSGVSDGR